MSVSVSFIMQMFEGFAPKIKAYDWDNVGLLVGSPREEIKNILLCLDINEEVAEEAIAKDVNMIISHHPLIFKPLSSFRWDNHLGKILKKLINANINVYCAHTNLDISAFGVNHVLAERIGLRNIQVLKPENAVKLFKIVVFVPAIHLEDIRSALGKIGAGKIGNYSHCTFATEGIGTFIPLEDSNPYIGKKNLLEEVREVRLETIVPEELVDSAIVALKEAHPYEEVAYDVYPLKNEGAEFGLGRIGEFHPPMQNKEFVNYLKARLEISNLKIAGNLPETIQKVAVCGGSGGNLFYQATFKGAQVLITGDIGYHQAQEAVQEGLCIIDAGHHATERPIVSYLAGILEEKLKDKSQVKVFVSKVDTEPWRWC